MPPDVPLPHRSEEPLTITGRPTLSDIMHTLASGNFESLIGIAEDAEVDAKGSPYRLSAGDSQRQELAKDVSALANAGGGIILIGFKTAKDDLKALERIDECRPFDLALFDADQHRKTLEEWIYPPIHSIRIESYSLASDRSRGVAAIYVPASVTDGKPFIVTKTVQSDGVTRGTLFGYYERVQDRVPATSSEMIRAQLRDGMRFGELSQRLSTIESMITSSSVPPSPPAVGLSDEEIKNRIDEAQIAVDRATAPCIILAATSSNPTVFTDIFRSDSELVRLIDRPPRLRRNGFGIHINRQSEIISGKMRRNLYRGSQIIDVWKDGLVVAIGEGDDALLCWWAGRRTRKGLPIRNFVLAEATLNFLYLAVEAFRNAAPEPDQLKFLLTLNNMTEDGVPCTLSTIPDKTESVFSMSNRERSASSATISTAFTTPFADIDVGKVAYQLLGGLYAMFGFNHNDMPYIQHSADGDQITPDTVLGQLERS